MTFETGAIIFLLSYTIGYDLLKLIIKLYISSSIKLPDWKVSRDQKTIQ